MMKSIFRKFCIIGIAAMAFGVAAQAHFQIIYTGRMSCAVDEAKELVLKLMFIHPFENSAGMNMGAEKTGAEAVKPKIFGVVDPKGKFKSLDVKAFTYEADSNSATGFEADYRLTRMGDYIFVCDPGYYWEKDEDCFIRHVTKLIVNNGGAPTGWDEPVAEKAGLPCEILPLDKPYALWTGNVFRGQVLKDGNPVPHAEIEVEFLNHDFDMKKNIFDKEGHFEAPKDSLVTQTIRADENGVFTYGIPKAGWWGFSALGLTEEKYQGKDVELAALIWIEACDMK